MEDSRELRALECRLTGTCEPIFEVFGFASGSENSRRLRQAITGMAAECLEKSCSC